MYILIVGAGPGISQGVATLFGQQGYQVALVARSDIKLHRQCDDMKREGIQAHYAVADASDLESLRQAVSRLQDHLGHPAMALYNAAAMHMGKPFSQSWEQVRRDLDVSVGGAYHLASLLLPGMQAADQGKLFFTGGGLSMHPSPQLLSLGMGKAALRNMVQALGEQVKDSGVHVAQLTVCGYVTPQDPKYNPSSIAQQYWKLFLEKRGHFTPEIIY